MRFLIDRIAFRDALQRVEMAIDRIWVLREQPAQHLDRRARCAQLLGQRGPAHARHHPVEQHQVDLLLFERCQRRRPSRVPKTAPNHCASAMSSPADSRARYT